jgi:hypothetical protein
MFVRFEAFLVGRRGVRGEISQLTVCSPADGYEVGVREADRPVMGDEESEVEDQAGPVDKLATDANAAPEQGTRRRRRGAASRPTARGLIAGLVRSYSPGQRVLTIVVGQAGTIRARVAEAAKVTIDTAAYNIARPGDAIDVTGTYRRRGQATARKVQIELTLPDAAVKRPQPRRRGRPGRRPAAARAAQHPPDIGPEGDEPAKAP